MTKQDKHLPTSVSAAGVAAKPDALRAELAAASSPREARAVQVKAEAMRDMLCRAMELAGEDAPALAHLRRESEELALNAMLKLGAMAPEGAQGARKDQGSTSPTVGEVAERAGIPRQTLCDYRKLHEAHEANPSAFAELVTAALDAGKSVPIGKLRQLLSAASERQRGTGATGGGLAGRLVKAWEKASGEQKEALLRKIQGAVNTAPEAAPQAAESEPGGGEEEPEPDQGDAQEGPDPFALPAVRSREADCKAMLPAFWPGRVPFATASEVHGLGKAHKLMVAMDWLSVTAANLREREASDVVKAALEGARQGLDEAAEELWLGLEEARTGKELQRRQAEEREQAKAILQERIARSLEQKAIEESKPRPPGRVKPVDRFRERLSGGAE